MPEKSDMEDNKEVLSFKVYASGHQLSAGVHFYCSLKAQKKSIKYAKPCPERASASLHISGTGVA